MDLRLEGKRVLITGGSKGIGKGIAKAFAEEGANVGIAARNKLELLRTQKELGIQIYQTDLAHSENREQLILDFVQDFNGIDILVNNMGGKPWKQHFKHGSEIFMKAMELNFITAVHLCQLSSRHLMDNKQGVIINISSIYGKEAGGAPSYNASKAALISFTKAFSTEVIEDNIQWSELRLARYFIPMNGSAG